MPAVNRGPSSKDDSIAASWQAGRLPYKNWQAGRLPYKSSYLIKGRSMNLTVAFRAGGNVAPCRFVTLGSSAFTIQAAGANQPPIGVSFSGTREAPVPSASPLLAIAGEGCPIWGPGETALLELGGTVATGALLKSDASGKGVAIASSGTDLQRYGAVALEPGASGERIRVLIQPGVLRPALT